MLNLIVGFVLGVVASGLGYVTLPSLVAKVKGWFNKEKAKVDPTVPSPSASVTPSDKPAQQAQ